jgi:tyrosyl-tRNA synthetase
MGVILDVEKTEVVNNRDWLAPLTFNEIIKLAGQVTINQLLAKEAFGDRMEKQLPVGFHELFYPLLQGYDSVAVRSDVELGGTDQRFNILQGRELQPAYGIDPPQMALLVPLLEGTDGVQKMSKSYGNYIGLKEPASDMFGKAMRIPDELIIKYFEFTTTLTGKEIDAIKHTLETGGNPKDAKEKLAHQIVRQYHGQAAADAALDEWNKVHSQRQIPDEMPSHVVAEPTMLFRVIVESKLASGTTEAKRLVQEGAVRLDGEQVKDPNLQLAIDGGTRVLQVGRRKFVRLVNPRHA